MESDYMLIPMLYKAKADIKGSSEYSSIKGDVYFSNYKNGVMVTVKLEGLPKDKDGKKGRFFGFHIHDGTSCTGNTEDEFKDANTHLNPNKLQHPFHIGDLPPIIECGGRAYMEVLVDKFKISDIIGKVIILHDMPDDFTTQPSGNAGKKIACGKIEKI